MKKATEAILGELVCSPTTHCIIPMARGGHEFTSFDRLTSAECTRQKTTREPYELVQTDVDTGNSPNHDKQISEWGKREERYCGFAWN